jgi:phosphoglycolate phosphatase-like HAD superfamily hydrolase
VRHVVWDWNGTLLADFDLVREATASSLSRFSLSAMDADAYRSAFDRPLRRFYENLVGAAIDDDAWRRADDAFHEHYRARVRTCSLATGAAPLLDAVTAAGATQSLLSMFRHGELVPLLDAHRLTGRFIRVDGDTVGDGGSKLDRLVAHLSALTVDPAEVILVGDTLDDAAAAEGVGAACVLVAEHSCHHERDLRAAAPTYATLSDAAAYLLSRLAA